MTSIFKQLIFSTTPFPGRSLLVLQGLEPGHLLSGRLDCAKSCLMVRIEDENLLPEVDALGKFFGAISYKAGFHEFFGTGVELICDLHSGQCDPLLQNRGLRVAVPDSFEKRGGT